LNLESFLESAHKLRREVGATPSGLDPDILEFAVTLGTVKLLERARVDREAMRSAIDGLFDALVEPYEWLTRIWKKTRSLAFPGTT
jgi:hypothetical protein